ncbi:MAG: glycosyltransferase family 4 protein [Sulfuricurvum sp.]|jgi:glycosyltransferase involved in cell wall biosynthesis|uniref:glycosyltransferase family 4 protein n=1 Tax=Sulfuricurvum sp. TaxID=2025608 RepID=UPI0025E28ED6|nr:glycosyltransferase family 4 protein [Sulfuricurvum sp.]MCK9372281.1 glycosyltransferase family 4 protein [Sulfuricurvum sp.]
MNSKQDFLQEAKSVKIAIIDHVGNKAGMDYYDCSLAKGLEKNECETFLFSNFLGRDTDKIKYHSVFEGHTKSNPLKKLFYLLRGVLQASYRAKKYEVDLVILHLFYANAITLILIAVPRLFGLKTLVVSHDVTSFVENDNKAIQQLIYNQFSTYVVVHNHFSYNTLIKNININNIEKVKIIKQGGYIDLVNTNISKADARRKMGLEEDQKYILFFGQIKKVKGLDILLEAMSNVSNDIKLIIAGKPLQDDMNFYNEIIKKHHLEDRVIQMIRFIEDEERENLFLSADVNVLPYRIIYQSAVLLMAMSHGVAVIASDLPANKEVITDQENGLLFVNENPKDLADKINLFFNTPNLKDTLSFNAKKTIEQSYSWDEIAKSYIEIVHNGV